MINRRNMRFCRLTIEGCTNIIVIIDNALSLLQYTKAQNFWIHPRMYVCIYFSLKMDMYNFTLPDLSTLSAEAADLTTAPDIGTSDLSIDSSPPNPGICCCKRSGQFMRLDSLPSEIQQPSPTQTLGFLTRNSLRKACKSMLIVYLYT